MSQLFRLLFTVSILAAILNAQFNWTENGLPIRQGNELWWTRAGDSVSDTEVVFAWSDTRHGNRNVRASKVNFAGQSLWGEEGFDIGASDDVQEVPQVVGDGQGGAYIVWVEYDIFHTHISLRATHINSQGYIDEQLWGVDGTALTSPDQSDIPFKVCSDELSGAFVVWIDMSDHANPEIRGQRLTTSGPLPDPETAGLPIAVGGIYGELDLENAGSGEAVLVWTDWIGDGQYLHGQRVDNTLTPLWSEPEENGIPICSHPSYKSSPKLAMESEDIVAVVWVDLHNDMENGDIFLQRIQADGGLLMGDGGEAVCTAELDQQNPQIVATESGLFIVWEDGRNSNQPEQNDIYAQHWTSAGGMEWAENGTVVSGIDGNQYSPRLIADQCGGVFIIWDDERDASFPEVDIYLQHYSPDLIPTFPTHGLALVTAPFQQSAPLILPTENCSAFAAWRDLRSGSPSLFMQSVNPQDGPLLVENGQELVEGISGKAQDKNILSLDNDEILVYWSDQRFGSMQTKIMGQIVDQNYDLQDFTNGEILDT